MFEHKEDCLDSIGHTIDNSLNIGGSDLKAHLSEHFLVQRVSVVALVLARVRRGVGVKIDQPREEELDRLCEVDPV